MYREDIIRMAREAELEDGWLGWCQECGCDSEKLARFAHLVYEANFRDANIAASRTILDAAVLQEREACAQIADAYAQHHSNNPRKGEEMNTEEVLKLMLQIEPEMAVRIKEHGEGMEGFTEEDPKLINFWPFKNYVKFAALVAAAEREACAKVADEVGDRDSGFHAYDAADAIRARSNP